MQTFRLLVALLVAVAGQLRDRCHDRRPGVRIVRLAVSGDPAAAADLIHASALARLLRRSLRRSSAQLHTALCPEIAERNASLTTE